MKKRLHDILIKNLGWKIMSVLLAIALWFIGINAENPTNIQTFDLNLTVRESAALKENGFILTNESELKSKRVVVRVLAAVSDLTNLANYRNSFYAYIDLQPVITGYSGSGGLPLSADVKIQFPDACPASNYQLMRVTPHSVDLSIENYITETKRVIVDKTGDPRDGYVAMPTVTTPDTVDISGPKSLVDQVDSVHARINVKGATSTVTAFSTPIVYDKRNNDITGQFAINTDAVNITVPIHKITKFPIKPTVVGNVINGYVVSNVIVEPEGVELVGFPADLDAFADIVLKPVNVDNLSTNKTETFDLTQYLADTNVTLKTGSPTEVSVTVVIEREQVAEIKVPVDRLNVVGIKTAVDLPKDVTLIIKGSKEAVSAVTAQNISGTIDISALPVGGTYRVPVVFKLPQNVIQLNDPLLVNVTIAAAAGS